ncbi:copper transporter [Intrasporangium sp. YIM S08009]|uniref:copper transporter n=1 Tax=Intrasporangium zincisolvens TaxID=3080018 RepID=UPI002B057774|nr:copper transporter [Intrasporangium sp. YIM S08009]
MIDFRYHLVSIISIFLALAVGIVLGAGPLQSTIGDTLGDQVIALRSEKQTLNDKLTTSEKLVEASDEYETAVQPRVVQGRLTGHRVVTVVLPSADGSLADSLENVVPQSGATSTGTVTVSQDWFDPSQAADREQAAKASAAALGLHTNASGDALLDEVLTHLLVSRSETTSSAQRTAALKVLTDAGLVDSSADDLAPADLAVVVSGDFAGTQAAVDTRSDNIRSIVSGLASGSNGTVVAGGEPVAAAGQPASSDAVAAVRSKSETADVVATVDHARAGNGPAVVVLAVEGLLDDRVGHYGISSGATATVPRVLP